MTTIELNIALFRERFPQFAIPAVFPDAVVTVNWVMATQYVSDSSYGCMAVTARELAIQLMTAHLMALAVIQASGGGTGTPGIVTGATIDKVSVSLATPPYGTDEWRYWLNLTPYGTQLLALLSAQAAGGFYVGGWPERSAFRVAGGVFR
jgi:hypothetical protein